MKILKIDLFLLTIISLCILNENCVSGNVKSGKVKDEAKVSEKDKVQEINQKDIENEKKSQENLTKIDETLNSVKSQESQINKIKNPEFRRVYNFVKHEFEKDRKSVV